MSIDVVIVIFVAIWLSVAVGGFAVWGYNRFLWEAARRDRYANRYRFDDLGNPEFYFNSKTGVDYLPASGNKAYSEHFIPVQTVSEKRTKPDPQIFVQGSPLLGDAPLLDTSKALTSGWKSLSNQEVIDLIEQGIEQGMSKTQTLNQLFGIKGGPDFTKLGKTFDRLNGKE